jgi:hypothetical protein
LSYKRITLALFWILLFPWIQIRTLFMFIENGPAWADSQTLRPVGDRAETDWAEEPLAGDYWEKIDDVSADEDTTYLYAVLNGSSGREGWYHTDFTETNNIDSVRLTIRGRSLATSGTSEIIIGRWKYLGEGIWIFCDYGSQATDTISLTSDYRDYIINWINDPYDGASWTMAKLNSTSRAWGFENNLTGTASDTFGVTTQSTTYNPTSGYMRMYRYQADFSGIIDTLVMRFDDATPNGNVSLGIYSDSGSGGGYPYERLDTTAWVAVTDGWLKIPLVTGNVSVTSGTYYWMASRVTTTNTAGRNTDACDDCHRYKSISGIWPNPAPSGCSVGDNVRDLLIGIGDYTAENRVTQSFIDVFYTVGAVVRKKPGGIVQDEENRGIVEGGIAR